MPDWIMENRIASLTASLETVRGLMEWVSGRQKCLEDMEHVLDDASKTVARCARIVGEPVHYQLMQAEFAKNDTARHDLERAFKATVEVSQVADKLVAARDKMRSLSRICPQITRRGAAQEIQQYFADEAEDLLRELRAVNKASPDAWNKYEQVRIKAQRLFAEFSELMAGLALRDSGFDEDIWEMTDQLLKSFRISPATSTDHLTIPIPHEIVVTPPHEMVQILRDIIRLSYHDWTLWSLPLVANEFWQAYTSKPPRLLREFQRRSGGLSVDDTQLCLADAFGACCMGPAYAYCAFLLSLNPVNALTDSDGVPAASKRAEAILLTLDWMNGKSRTNDWSVIIRSLRESWKSAVEAANGSPADLDPDTVGKLERAAPALGEALLNTGAAFLSAASGSAGLQRNDWSYVLNLRNFLKDRLAGEDSDIKIDISYRLCDVINAAWLVRVEDSERNALDPIRVKKIEEGALEMRKRIPQPPELVAVSAAGADYPGSPRG